MKGKTEEIHFLLESFSIQSFVRCGLWLTTTNWSLLLLVLSRDYIHPIRGVSLLVLNLFQFSTARNVATAKDTGPFFSECWICCPMGCRIVHAFKASCSLMLPTRGREKTKAWNKTLILLGKWACVLSVSKHPVHTCVRTTWFRMQLLFQIYMPFDPTSFVNVTELSCCVIARVYATCRIWGQHFSPSLPVGERNRCVE